MQKLPSIVVAMLLGATAAAVSAQPPQEGAQEPAQAFIDQLDEDGDGKVSLEEALQPQGPRFSEIDADGDGIITADEAAETFQSQVPTEMLEAMKERGMQPGQTFVDNLDTNNDGQVDKGEFEQPTVEAFQRMDTDGNGFATPDEASAYFAQMKQQMEEQMRRMQEQQQQMQ